MIFVSDFSTRTANNVVFNLIYIFAQTLKTKLSAEKKTKKIVKFSAGHNVFGIAAQNYLAALFT